MLGGEARQLFLSICTSNIDAEPSGGVERCFTSTPRLPAALLTAISELTIHSQFGSRPAATSDPWQPSLFVIGSLSRPALGLCLIWSAFGTAPIDKRFRLATVPSLPGCKNIRSGSVTRSDGFPCAFRGVGSAGTWAAGFLQHLFIVASHTHIQALGGSSSPTPASHHRQRARFAYRRALPFQGQASLRRRPSARRSGRQPFAISLNAAGRGASFPEPTARTAGPFFTGVSPPIRRPEQHEFESLLRPATWAVPATAAPSRADPRSAG